MKRESAVDINRLNEVLENPDLEEDFQDVFSFVETITGQTCSLGEMTSRNIEAWNMRFDEVLKQLLR